MELQDLLIGAGNLLLVVVAGQLRSISLRLIALERRVLALELAVNRSNSVSPSK